MALTICNCFREMRDWKVEIQQMVRNFPLFCSEKKEDCLCWQYTIFEQISGKLGCLLFSKIIRKFWLKVKWNGNFCGNSDRKLQTTFRGRPLFPLRTERRKFPNHFLNFLVCSLSSADNNCGKSNWKWKASSRSVGLLFLGKLLPLFMARPNRFILTSSKHP